MSEPVRASHPESFHRIPVGMCRRAVNGTFLWANAAILELLGATTLDTLLELDHLPEAPHEHESFVQRLVAQGPLGGISATWRTLRGDAVEVRIHAAPYFDDGNEPLGYDAVIEKTAPPHEVELELRTELAKAREALVGKDRFLANLSHEVRTPLTAIIGFASVLARELPPEHQRHAELIERSGRRLVDTMDAVLTYAKLEAEGHVLTSETVDVASVVREAVKEFELRAISKDLALSSRQEGEGPFSTMSDPAALHRILSALIGNAIKFTEEGEVAVVLRRLPHALIVDVSDTGIGMDAEFLPHAFEPFRQESSGMGRSHEGTGIGLAVAERLAQMMSARIEVQSTKGEGSTFSFIIPLLEPADGTDVTNGTATTSSR